MTVEASDDTDDAAPFPEFNSEKALIFRIVHKANLPWILDHGIHSRMSPTRDPGYIEIGNPDLMAKRRNMVIGATHRISLAEYVPFYFTPRSPMMLNILTGRNGVQKRAASDIAILVASLRTIAAAGHAFLFTDRHANNAMARVYDDLRHLAAIDWHSLQRSDFRRTPDDPDKFDRYQAEALVHNRVGIEHVLGLACYDGESKGELATLVADRCLNVPVFQQKRWYGR